MPSSVIRFHRYDPELRALTVGFQSGRKYVYQDVPAAIVEGLEAAYSKGEYFNEHIRDRFSFMRYDGISG